MIVHEDRIVPLLVGEQHLSINDAMQWRGGAIPVDDDSGDRAMALAQRAVRTVPGLHGFVGVDLILGDAPAHDRVVEINPRLTMSYPVLRELCEGSLAAATLDADTPLGWRSRHLRYDAAGRITHNDPR